MRIYVKIASVFILLLLSVPVVLFIKGCGTAVTGGACGGCPDSPAPSGSSITGTTGIAAPSPTAPACAAGGVRFQIIGPDGTTPLSDICVELTTNGAIGDYVGDCSAVNASRKIMRTDQSGVVTVDFAMDCATTGLHGPVTFFVQANSCAISATASAASVTCP